VENGGIAPRILNLGSRWILVISFTPSRFFTPSEEKKSFSPTANQTTVV